MCLLKREKHIKNDKSTIHSKGKKMIFSEGVWGYIFIFPFILGLVVFFLLPALASFYLSFTEWDGLSIPKFNGIENLKHMMSDASFKRALINTMLFTFIAVPLSITFATIIAVLLNQKIKGMVVYRTLFFIPIITMPVAVGVIWKWLYNTEFGLFNHILGFLSLPQPDWLFDERIALLSIVITYVWMTVGNNTIILLAGLQGISSYFYEAAEIDGAGRIKKFFYITLPLLTPSIFFVLVMSIINSLQVFDLVYMMMGDNVALLRPTRTIVYSMYEQGFEYYNMGYASAQAFLLFLIILLLTILQLNWQKRWVHYQ